MAKSSCELVWIYQLLVELEFDITTPTKLWRDNQGTLHIASNPIFHETTKHIDVDCHFVRKKTQRGLESTIRYRTSP